MRNKLFLSGLAFVLVTTMFAQETIQKCGTVDAMEEIFKKDPSARARFEAMQIESEQTDKENFKNGYHKGANENKISNPNHTSGIVYVIPIVYHILHLGGPENISNAQVLDAVRVLNLDYRRNSPDTINTDLPFVGLEADAEIEFRLATIDPNGNCTNGIVRHYDANTNWQQSSPNFIYTWPRNKYLNVYVVSTINGSSGIVGYTNYPGFAGAANDVFVVRHAYTGTIGTAANSIGGMASTHEIGHWLNLQHVWGNSNNPGVACGNDGVTDTPLTKGRQNFCPQGAANIDCTPGVNENVNNYMDYTWCSTMFTGGQATRVRNTLINNTGNVGRSNLWTAANLIATGVTNPQVCVPVADFKVNKNYICTGNTITFSDLSTNATPTSWSWSFPGGTPATSTDSIPIITYNTPGVYAVTYTATTITGSNSITKTAYIYVTSSTAQYQTMFSEGFEGITFPSADWSVKNVGGGNSWATTTSAAYTGTTSAMMSNFGNTTAQQDELVGTTINVDSILTATGACTLTFKVAYQQKATTNLDKLQLYTSTNCGNTWVAKWTKTGTALATTTTGTIAFTPTSTTQWRNETVNLFSLIGNKNVLFKFLFTSDATAPGNNLYLDDINIQGSTVGIATQIDNLLDLNIYPNPATGIVNVNFNLDAKATVSAFVSNVLGQTVETVVNTSLSAGEYKYTINNTGKLKSGLYLINFSVNGKNFTKKLIIE